MRQSATCSPSRRAEYYSLLEALTDSFPWMIMRRCHQQDADGIGTRFSGDMTFVEDTIYGQYGEPRTNTPSNGKCRVRGFMPVYGEHMGRSSCAAHDHLSVTLSEYTERSSSKPPTTSG